MRGGCGRLEQPRGLSCALKCCQCQFNLFGGMIGGDGDANPAGSVGDGGRPDGRRIDAMRQKLPGKRERRRTTESPETPATNRARLVFTAFVLPAQAVALTAGQTFHAVDLRMSSRGTIGTGACNGCASSACLVFNSVLLKRLPGSSGPDVLLSDPAAACTGDFDGDGEVAINEAVRGVNIALGNAPVGDCAQFDANGDGSVAVNELIAAVEAGGVASSFGPGSFLTDGRGKTSARPANPSWSSCDPYGRRNLLQPRTYELDPQHTEAPREGDWRHRRHGGPPSNVAGRLVRAARGRKDRSLSGN